MHCMKSLFCIVAMVLLCSFVQKEPESKIVKYTTRNGLPLKVINSITQDKQGFMWFAAEDGIARFDGYTFKIFKNDPDDSFSLSHNYVFSIFTDREGIVWAASRKGVNRFDSRTERFIHYQHDPKNKNSLVGNDVSYISETPTGNLWVSSWAAGFTYIDKKKSRLIQYSQKNLPGLSSVRIVSVYEDDEGLLWVGSLDGGLDIFKTKDGIVSQRVESLPHDTISALRNVRCMRPDHFGNVWIGTIDGLVFFNRKQQTFQLLNTGNSALKGNVIRSLQEDSHGNLWIGVEDKGLHKISLNHLNDTSPVNFKVESVTGSDEYGVYKLTIHSIYEDRDKNIWLATNGEGAQMISGIKEKFMRIEVKLSEKSDRTYARFWGMCSDEEKNLWLGSDGNGLYKYSSNGTLLKHYDVDGKKGSLTDQAILCAFRDHTNTLWFGTYSQGLFRYNKKTDTFTNYKHDPDNPKSLGRNDVRVIFEDSKHNLWVGTNWGGLNLLDQSTGTFTKYTIANSTISSGDIRAIIEDKQGGLWLGSSKGGVNYFDPEKKTFTQYFNDPESKNDLSGNMIYALHFDKRGRMWIGTEGAGLLIYDSAQHRLHQIGEKDGLFSSTIFAIQQDATGNVWISSNTGITKWDKNEKKFYNYDASDGLQNGQFNSCSFLYDKPLGLMAFAGTEGVTLFHPEQIKSSSQHPDIRITKFELFNKPVEINTTDKDAVLKQSISQTDAITLRYDQSVFTFEFAALNYTLPEKNQYAYKMENFDKNWNYVGSSRTATYTNLDPGDYIFRVKASNTDGVWNEQSASITIHIIPPWWRTWWFRIVTILVLAGIGVGYYKIRVRTIKEQNRKLEHTVLEKTKELQSANEELVVREEEIKAQNEDLSLQNEELTQRQEEIATQRDLLAEQNQRLEDAWKTIEQQNKEILLHNRSLDLEIKERTQELVEYNQQLEQFAFITAHNLRAPVARILGLGKVLELIRKDPIEAKLIVDKLIFTTEELDTVVKDVSTVLEIRKNKTYVVGKLNFEEELAIIKENLEHEITETRAEIIDDFSEANVIHTAKPYLDSILINLIHNAIKYRDVNRRLSIHVKTGVTDGYICLTIRDNGLGIDLGLHKKNMFNLYKRFHTHVEGKGMGLYLVKAQVVALGGKIEVESEVNVGTTFKVFLKNNEPAMNRVLS
jgi:ligand-binding sensor domain-containing protein/signal transduction histidine kinase